MFKLPFEVTKTELMQILPHNQLLGAAVALALVAISAAYIYYTSKPKGKTN
jgi:hypothetical protein